jgi:hypothetical protein
MNKRIKASEHPMTIRLHNEISQMVGLARDITEMNHRAFCRSLLSRYCASLAHVQSLVTMLLVNEGVTVEEVLKLQEIGEELVDEAIAYHKRQVELRASGAAVPIRPLQTEELGAADLGAQIRELRKKAQEEGGPTS